MDFKTTKDLSQYLIYLDKNSTAYNSYFKWRKHVNFLNHTVGFGFLCEMCIHLHLETYFGITKKVYNDWNNYWNKDTQCKPPQTILN